MRSCIDAGLAVPSILWLLVAVNAAGAPASHEGVSLKQGDEIKLGGRRCLITRLDSLPYVDSQYTQRFKFDSHQNSKLKLLRERFQLAEVVSTGQSEFDRQVLLLDWVHERIRKFGRPTSDARGALNILQANEAGHTFFCAHYADVMVSAAASLGWIARSLALRRPDHIGQGATEHTSTEIWSNQHRKWILFDPTFAMYVEKNGVPLNAFEVRQEWFHRDGADLNFVIGRQRRRFGRSEMPILRKHFPGFGDLSVDPSALNVYAFIGYIPNTNLMDAGPDYAQMFITQDALCSGTKWHKRLVPADPAQDPYFPINQSALSITPDGEALRVDVKTLTPNFKTYLHRIDAGEWREGGNSFIWRPHRGKNELEVKTLNQFGVEGPISGIELQVESGGPAR